MDAPDEESERRLHQPHSEVASIPGQGDEVRELSHVECWDVLGDKGVGHLGLRAQPVGVDIVPINYLIRNRQLFFRSGPGTKLEDIVQHPYISVQVERLEEGIWSSVILKGKATRMAFDEEIERSGVMDLVSEQPGGKFNYVRMIPDAITGRSFAAR